LFWCDADYPLEMKTELALVRETGAYRHLCETHASSSTKKLLRPFNASVDEELVWRQSCCRLELLGCRTFSCQGYCKQ